MSQSSSSKNQNNLVLLVVIIVGIVGIILYTKPNALQNLSQKSQVGSKFTEPPFSPLPFLSNCGFDDTFRSGLNSNAYVVDARLNGSLKGTIKTIFKDALELSQGAVAQPVKIPLMGKNGMLSLADKLVFSPTTNTPSAISTLKEGQTVTVAFMCRPKVATFQFLSPTFQVLSILVNK